MFCRKQIIHNLIIKKQGERLAKMWVRFSVVILLFYLHLSQERYVLDMKIIEFSNPSKKLENGKCCDSTWGVCGDCDIRFERCLSDKKHIGSYLDCNIERYVSDEYKDTNTLKFPSLKLFDGRAIYKINRPWKGYASLMIEVCVNLCMKNNLPRKKPFFIKNSISQ